MSGVPTSQPAPELPHVLRIEVPNVDGSRAFVVEGPVDELPALEDAVDRMMRRVDGKQNDETRIHV